MPADMPSGPVWVHGPMIKCTRSPAAWRAQKSSSIQGRKMSYQPPMSCTGALTSVTPAV